MVEINLTILASYPLSYSTLPLTYTLQCMWHRQKYITGTRTFPINIQDGWKHTTEFHNFNRPRRADTRRSNTLDNSDVKVTGKKGGWWSLQNWGGIGLSSAQQAGKTYPDEQAAETQH